MKRLFALLCAALILAFSLCACAGNALESVKQTASEAMSDMKKDATDYSNDNNGLLDDNRETSYNADPTADNTDGIFTDDGNMETVWDDMVEDGKVEDGDGNVGDLENNDDDANVDVDAVE